jgi:hypothetical protein
MFHRPLIAGCPGDRKTRSCTLRLDYPNVGGPSPGIRRLHRPPRLRLAFASPDDARHVFDIALQDQPTITKLALPAKLIATTETIPNIQVTDGTLTVKLNAIEGETILSGLEIIRQGLKIGDVPDNARVPDRL